LGTWWRLVDLKETGGTADHLRSLCASYESGVKNPQAGTPSRERTPRVCKPPFAAVITHRAIVRMRRAH
jgi:hypothetical protein